jgi:two-component system sensor histidine kinase KdpD
LAIGSVVACTALSFILSSHLALVDLAMLYLLGIVFTASRTGPWPSLLATVLSVASFDFFFVPPYFTFAVSEPKYLLTFVVMFVVYVITSRLTLHIREQAEAARHRERRTSALYHLSRELTQVREFKRLCAVAISHITELVSRRAAILVPDGRGDLLPVASSPSLPGLNEAQMNTARRVFEESKGDGSGVPSEAESGVLYLPLVAATGEIGVVAVLPEWPTRRFHQEQIDLLRGLTNQVAMALERAMLADEAHEAQLTAERETLRSTLLSSVSHDLRTPLATITGAATTLLQKDVKLGASDRQELVQTICEEADHLNHIIRNVLDMTRIEAGAIAVKKEWQPIEEIVGAVLNRLSDRLKDRPFKTELPEDLPLVSFDPLLIEQVLTNLLDNAIKYTPEGTPLELSAALKDRSVVLEVADRGPGIPAGEEDRIFEKFVRGPASGGGIGLGLTICRAIVQAHGGRIWAENRPGGGALFRFTLPLEGKPPAMELELEEMSSDRQEASGSAP